MQTRSRRSVSRIITGAAALGCVVAIAGCGSSGDATQAGGEEAQQEASPTQSGEQSVVATTDAPAEATASEAPREDETRMSDSGTDCLDGDWVVPESELQAFYDSIDAPAEFELSGLALMSFEADVVTYIPDMTLTMDVAGQSVTAEVGGQVTGSYTTSDGVLTVSNEDNDLDVLVTLGENRIDAGEQTGSFISAFPVSSSPYSCTDTGPVIVFENGDDTDAGTEVHLEAA